MPRLQLRFLCMKHIGKEEKEDNMSKKADENLSFLLQIISKKM